ncbi:ClbS/DfsB family four-helix bundle protein [Listeria monocytogenes]|uniref:ClbS/DfsB family four-helix bundle protein n=1 Tax=Listeria monocytogenes TaxID=1639 RepID=UPI0011EB547C|nr:ClbS/DfsB family four-helix bundle protein [Listeria monocytogenes]ECB9471486.1 ClbS/DfsB family four-helix bundle protein [Listeria monocytogenes]ECB9516935.1 ClbS/DfsB family four-helix bundle protein [Listeria monocytogenes]ECB9522893.1 ClbS/DfsB family four-helix bundle protein [Listeria monocytogenes]ECB9529818.1 ClbS/DfsB family four-helix bundle protein [Listeria monocytogenes]EIL5479032.1 ClbS/DfsB family four-helix bundle protein [Listeria monocytogenes]
MARPKNKVELLQQSTEKYQQLNDLINSIPKEKQQLTFPFEDRDKNIRDVVIHLHEWHKMALGWYEVGMGGKKPFMPAEGFTWKTTPELNLVIWQKYQETDLAQARELLDETHNKEMVLIAGHLEEELFTKKYYKWTNTTSLGAIFISSTSSHYDWAIKKIRKFKKAAGIK